MNKNSSNRVLGTGALSTLFAHQVKHQQRTQFEVVNLYGLFHTIMVSLYLN